MTDDLDKEAQELFERAVERPSHERAEFLDGECGDRGDLRNTVDGLLQRHTETATNITLFLEAAAAGETQASDRLWSAVYTELRALARQKLQRESPGKAYLAPTFLFAGLELLFYVIKQLLRWLSIVM